MKEEGMTTTYTIQSHLPSGSVHALIWHDNTIVAISDALSSTEVAELAADELADLDYTDYEGDPEGLNKDGLVEWDAPILSYVY
jgi:hypothetical protein